MTLYRVGEPYPSTAIPAGAEGGHLRLGDAQLLILLPAPTENEVDSVRHGAARFAWVDAGHSGILCFRFDPGLPWSDVPYTPHREPGVTIGDGSRLLLTVFLLDTADDARILVMRSMTWSPNFTSVVRNTVARMAAAPWDEAAADRAVASLYARHLDTAGLVTTARTACQGGS